jgi:pimeloyl-ACP methyl ester carboxylesterase
VSELRRVSIPPFEFWESRAGAGTPVVFVHGLSGSSSWWRRNLPVLAREHEVAAIDLIGFGRNRRFFQGGPLPPRFDEVASLIARWIESSFDQPVHLVGHSMGGLIAIHVAALRPECLRSLVLVDATGIPFTLDPRDHLRHLPHPPRGLFSFSRVLAWDFLRAGPTSVGVAAARLLREDAREAMSRITVPTLLVWGDRDVLVPERYGREMQEAISEASLVVLPNAGHVSMWDNADAFNQELLDFFTEVEKTERETESGPPRRGFSWGIAGCYEGICYRAAGSRAQVILVHGLGMSSSYFRELARSIHRRGFDVLAPDLRGFGYSGDAPAAGPEWHARALLGLARELRMGPAVWVGHSTGCHVVKAVATIDPDAVAAEVYLSPVWTSRRRRFFPLGAALVKDVFREPLALVPEVAGNYWRVGLLRWMGTLRHELRAAAAPGVISDRALMVAGVSDPLTDWASLADLAPERVLSIPGAHAICFSHPEEVAEAVVDWSGKWLG